MLVMDIQKPGPRDSINSSQTVRGLVFPAVVAALLMAAALVGCSAGPNDVQNTAMPVHAQAIGQANGNLTGNFPTASMMQRHRGDRGANGLYATASTRARLAR